MAMLELEEDDIPLDEYPLEPEEELEEILDIVSEDYEEEVNDNV
jgi:hypothetical protein